MTWMRALNIRESGFTLMELMAVIAIAGMVTLGLVAFYLTSQAMWMDASTQALAQRDATTLAEYMRDKTRGAAQALVESASPDSLNHKLTLFDGGGHETDSFFWSPADSLVHHGTGDGDVDQGPVVPTIVERFYVSLDGTLPLVSLDTLRVRSTTGQKVQMSTGFALYNATP